MSRQTQPSRATERKPGNYEPPTPTNALLPRGGPVGKLSRVEIKKAVITAAGKNQRTLPLQTLVDRDGTAKTALRIIIEEIHSAGIEQVCVVVCPGDQAAYATNIRQACATRSPAAQDEIGNQSKAQTCRIA